MRSYKSRKEENLGITLIALIITVIIMLILAGVVISLTIGDNGIIKRTKESAERYKIAQIEEKINMKVAEYELHMEKETLYRFLNKIEGLESISPDNEIEGPPYQLVIEGYEFLVKEDLTVEYVKKIESRILPQIDSVKKVEGTDKQVTIEIKASTKDSLGLKEIRIVRDGVEVDKIENLSGAQVTKTYNIAGNGTYKLIVIAGNGTQVASEEIEITGLTTTSGTIQEGTNINGQILLSVKANSQEEIKKVYVYHDNSNELIDEINCSGKEIETETRVELAFFEGQTYRAEIQTDYEKVATNKVSVRNDEYIKTEADLQKLAEVVNGGTSFEEKKSIKQVADITLSQNHIVIGKEGTPFNGIYNGQGHSIKNVKVNGTEGYDYGVFGYVEGKEEKYAEISNLTVEGTISGTFDVGGVVGRIQYANVKNCTNRAEVKSTKGDRLAETNVFLSCVGGIVGRIGTQGDNRVENCQNYGTVTGVQEGIGGIVGWARNGTVVDCQNNVNITGNTNRIGGIVGSGLTSYDDQADQYIVINRCINNGNISGKVAIGGIIGLSGAISIQNSTNNGAITATGSVEEGCLAGGIVGRVHVNGETNNGVNNNIYKCINNAIVKGSSDRVGGIVGCMYKGTIEKCINNNNVEGNVWTAGICGDAGYNTGKGVIYPVTISKCKNTKAVKGSYEVGGIVGRLRRGGVVEQSCNTGDVTSTSYNSENYANTGGIAGATGNHTISYCYNTGSIVSQNRVVGGMIGSFEGTISTIKNCYNVGNITNNSAQYTGKTAGIVGTKINGTINVTNCWYLKDCVKKGTDNDKVGGTEKTEAEIKALTWENFMKDGVNNGGYPILSWEKE